MTEKRQDGQPEELTFWWRETARVPMSSLHIDTEHREGNKGGPMTVRVAALGGVIREGLSEEVTSKLKHRSREGASHVRI